MILKDNNLIPWEIDKVQINTIGKWSFGLYIYALSILRYKRWGIECIRWGEIKCVGWGKPKPSIKVKLETLR